MKTIKYSALADACYAAGLEPEEIIRTDYSSRWMFGETCFGLDVGDLSQALTVLVLLAMHAADDADPYNSANVYQLPELASVGRWDNMGLGLIVYFPGWQVEGAPEGGDDDGE